jgi:CelD/BcsL family acetyltransferase involved in cellulose biosynthesis
MIDVSTSTLSLVAAMTPDAIEPVIARSKQQLAAIRSQWFALQHECGMSAPQAMYDLFVGTLDVISGGSRPYVVIFKDQHGGRAMIVGRLSHRSLPCKFGYAKLTTPMLNCLEIMDGGLITDGTAAARAATLSHLRQMLTNREVELLIVERLSTEHELFQPLWSRALSAPREMHWKLSLADGYEQMLKKYSGKHRLTLRKKDRVLVEHFDNKVELKQFVHLEEVPTFLKTAAALNAQTYQGALGVGLRDDARWRAILNVEARAGRMRGYWLECDGVPIVFQVGAIWGDTYKLLATSFLPQHAKISPGIVLHMRVLHVLCEEGVKAVDYGFGDADYKRTYGSESWEESTLHLFGQTPRAMLAWGMSAIFGAASRSAKKIAVATGAMQWLKRKWRERLAKSVK